MLLSEISVTTKPNQGELLLTTDNYKCGTAVLTDTWNFPEHRIFFHCKIEKEEEV